MGRYIFALFAVFSFSGCSILNRVDLALERLDQTNQQLGMTNQQIGVMNEQLSLTNQQVATITKQMTQTQSCWSNRIALSSPRTSKLPRALQRSSSPTSSWINRTRT